MGIEEAGEEDEEMEGSDDKQEEEEWQDVAGGEASPVTPEASESEEEDPDLTPGRSPRRRARQGLSQELEEPRHSQEGEDGGAASEARDAAGDTEVPKSDDEEEGVEAKGTRAVLRVTPEMREKHERTHCPFRSWCKYCIMGSSHKTPHKRDKEEAHKRGVPRISMDYFYMSQRDEEAK